MIKEEASESKNVQSVKEKKKNTYIRTSNVCKECSYATSDGSGLYKHIEKCHPNVKKYACDICSHSELREKAMKGHYENVHNVKKLKKELRTTGYEIFENNMLP